MLYVFREELNSVFKGVGGRAGQMNAGAKQARNKTLLFLHADTKLPPHYNSHIFASLSDSRVCAGAFRLSIDSNIYGIRVIERFANFRAVWLQKPYGDQGLFLRKSVFWKAGGFPQMPFMEDYEMVRHLSRMGRIAIAEADVGTSARRWEALGVFKTTILNQIIVACYHVGVPIHRLQRWYRESYRRAMQTT